MRLLSFLARRVLASVLLAAGAIAAAQEACPPPPPDAASFGPAALQRDVRDRGFLWRLEKDGRTSWLYGTVHVSRPEWVVPGPRVQAALAGSDVLALELDPADPELPRLFMTPADPARVQRVAGDLRPRIERIAARACLPAQQLVRLRPMLQIMMLDMHEGRRDGFHPELAVDGVLWGMAQRLDKRVVALETPAAQLATLTPASEADERVLLEQGLQDLESGEGRALAQRLLRTWAESDEAQLASYPQWCQCLATEAERRFVRQVNDERNAPMAAQLAALHASGSRFFAAVGALHMTGPKALHQLLREQGFQVQRISFSSSGGPR